MRVIYVILFIIILSVVVLISSYATRIEKYGEPISSYKSAEVSDILAYPDEYKGKTVTVEGKIVKECLLGYWFYLKVPGGIGIIYVDVGSAGFSIPQKHGNDLTVEGKVIIKGTTPVIEGRGVEIK